MNDRDSELRLSRRGALTLIAGIGLGAEVLQAGSTADAAGTKHGSVARAPIIMLIRHAERPVSLTAPFGINVSGEQDIASLTVRGWSRAGALVELFAPSTDTLRAGLARPTVVFSAIPSSASRRPFETVTPLAERLRMSVATPVQATETARIAHILASKPGVRLAAWEHQFIPMIARQLGTVHPTPPTTWPEDRFDVVWVFTRRKDHSWTFTQVPQLLLAGDRHSVIS